MSVNVFVLPVDKHGAGAISLLNDFDISSKHIARMEGVLLGYGYGQEDNPDFIAGAEKLIKRIEQENIYQAVDSVQDILIDLDHQSYYGEFLTEVLLTLSEKVFELEDYEDYEDYEDLSCHHEAYEIIANTLPYTDWQDKPYDPPSKNRALDLLLRFASQTPDPFLSIPITSLVVNSLNEDNPRREVIGNLQFARCQKIAKYSPLFVSDYLEESIDAMGQENAKTNEAISLWRWCMREINVDEAIDRIIHAREKTDNLLFVYALQDDLRYFESQPKPPRLELVK
jgi:hypothetical protein